MVHYMSLLIHKSPGITFDMSTPFGNVGSFIIQSGTFRMNTGTTTFHYGNFTVFPEGNFIIRGDHDFYGKVVGSVVFEEGTINVHTENFANEVTVTGVSLFVHYPVHFSSVTLNSASAMILQNSVVIDRITNVRF